MRPLLFRPIFFLALGIALFSGFINAYCINQVGSCSYYLCKENELNCGPKGYLVNYGYRYCNKFYQELESKLTASGSQWIQEAAVCLQEKIEHTTTASTSCLNVKKIAYASHSDCYSQASFCELPIEDKFKIIKFLKYEAFKYQTQKEGLQVLFSCFQSK